jgi:hypothetical protein
MSKSVLIIHPKDKTTSFLDRIKGFLVRGEFQDLITHFNVQLNMKSHSDCLKSLLNTPDEGLIIFLGHGTENKLYGAKGYGGNQHSNVLLSAENSESCFDNENFIDSSNISVFKNKKIFCLSCNSNDNIGKEAERKGVSAFLGFGALPTSIEELQKDYPGIVFGISKSTIILEFKTELNYIIKKSITYSIDNNFNFEQLVDIIKFITNQRINYFLINRKKLKERKIIVDLLYGLKKGIVVYGNKKEKLIG